jgi:hypothetical protein
LTTSQNWPVSATTSPATEPKKEPITTPRWVLRSPTSRIRYRTRPSWTSAEEAGNEHDLGTGCYSVESKRGSRCQEKG